MFMEHEVANTTVQKDNLLELIKRLGLTVSWVAMQMGWPAPRIYQGQIARGLATQEQLDKLASALRVDRAVVEDALRENARRYGQAKSSGGDAHGTKATA